MANFYGLQSLNGLGTFALFTAPAAGIYFVNGQLSLPQLVSTGGTGKSAVVAVVNVNGSPQYTGVAGCSGFQLNQLTLAAADVVTVVLSSAAAIDNAPTTNAVSGQVYFGNAF